MLILIQQQLHSLFGIDMKQLCQTNSVITVSSLFSSLPSSLSIFLCTHSYTHAHTHTHTHTLSLSLFLSFSPSLSLSLSTLCSLSYLLSIHLHRRRKKSKNTAAARKPADTTVIINPHCEGAINYVDLSNFVGDTTPLHEAPSD